MSPRVAVIIRNAVKISVAIASGVIHFAQGGLLKRFEVAVNR
jgi:hypothetical protein